MFLDKLGGTKTTEYIGTSGEIFYDPFDGILRLSNGSSPGGTPITGANANVTFIDGGSF